MASRCCSDQKLFYALHIVQRSVMVIFKHFMTVVGPLLHATAILLIFGIAFVYYLFIFPAITKDSTIKFIFHLCLSSLLVTNIFFNLISCAFTPPGSPSTVKDAGKILGRQRNPAHAHQPVSYSLRKRCQLSPGVCYKYCKTCKAVKPPRAHHCSVSGRCVYEMDHFCPWMNNCVGLFNYKYFVLFLAYLFLGCVYFMVAIGSEIITLNSKAERIQKFGADFPLEIVSLAFVVALGACISVGLLLAWHLYLVATNQTTIEFYINIENKMDAKSIDAEYKNPFDQGYRLNFIRLLGTAPWYHNLIPAINTPACPLYPLHVMAGVLTGENEAMQV